MAKFKNWLQYHESETVPATPPLQPLMLVHAKPIDVSVREGEVEKAITGMRIAVSQILQDEDAQVMAADDDGGQKTSWGELFGLSPHNSSNKVVIQYRPQIGRNVLGDLGWSANYWNKNWGKALLQKTHLVTDPEDYYLTKFRDELNARKASGILIGWPEDWEITTSRLGRNIILRPKSVNSKSST